MDGPIRGCPNNWVITIENSSAKHLAIIRSTVAKRAYHLFEQRGRKHGLDFDDWIAAEKQLWADDFSGDTSAYRFVVECPGNSEVTPILSLTPHSFIAFRSHASHIRNVGNGPEIVSVHLIPEEIDPTRVEVKRVGSLLHVHAPKKDQVGQR